MFFMLYNIFYYKYGFRVGKRKMLVVSSVFFINSLKLKIFLFGRCIFFI